MLRLGRLVFFGIVISLMVGRCPAQEGLPRVLILGDSVYNGLAREVAKALKGKAEVVYKQPVPGRPFNSHTVLADLAELLGEEPWDLIHFNVGLGDLVYRVPGIKSFRVISKDSGGVRATTSAAYEANLQEPIARLQKTRAKLVWASTTPIRSSSTRLFEPQSEVAYNAIALRVMQSRGVAVNDMHAKVSGVIDLNRPTSFDPFSFDKKPIHPFVVEVIVKQLNLNP